MLSPTEINVRAAINRSVLVLYRVFAIVSLYAVLVGVLVYALSLAFYAADSSWIVPVALSNVDKDSLDMTAQLVVSTQSRDDLNLDVARLSKQLAESKSHRASLVQLKPELDTAIAIAQRHKVTTAPVLINLEKQKSKDNADSTAAASDLSNLQDSIARDLKAGLITKSEAIQGHSQILQFDSGLTDSKIASVALRDNILERTAPDPTFLDIFYKRTELISEITNLDITIATVTKQIAMEQNQISSLNTAIATAMAAPSYVAIQSGQVDMAFVPYSNLPGVKTGGHVYDCLLSFLACRDVGRVVKIFRGEQHAIHPIFHTDMRGVVIQLLLSNPKSEKSSTLFVNGKPLLF
jgi:hypothetical protein